MSLQSKFAILLVALGLAMVAALSSAWWSLTVMQREVRRPVQSMSAVLIGLARLQDALNATPTSSTPSPPPREISGVTSGTVASTPETRSLSQLADALLIDQWALTLTGKSTFTNLRARVTEIESLPYLATGNTPDPERTRRIDDAERLIELIRRRIVEGSSATLAYGDEIRLRLGVVLGASMAVSLLAAVLGGLLVRRWVLMPVRELHAAAGRIGAGDFSYRVPVQPHAAASRDELQRLSAEVNTMAGLVAGLQDERVEQARLAAVGEMVRRLAHNLRNPLGGIRSLAELSRMELRAPAPPSSAELGELAEHQHRIIKAVDRFEAWLNDLLSVSTPADPASVNLARVDIPAWLDSVVEVHRPAATAKGLTLAVDTASGPPAAPIDRRHLDQAITAILANALDVAPNGSRIQITAVAISHPREGRWQVRIADQGPGVPTELRDRIFQPYFTTKRDGNGIGLASAFQAVRSHGGHLSVTDPPDGSGAVFVIDLPAPGDSGGHPRPEAA